MIGRVGYRLQVRTAIALTRTPQAKLAFGSLTFQSATLLYFVVLKIRTTEAFFSHFMAVMAVAAIIGAVASFRSEVLIMQADRQVSARTLLWPSIITLASTLLLFIVVPLIELVFGIDLPAYALLISFGYAFQQIAQFILIQLGRLDHLLAVKAAQSALIVALGLGVLLGLRADIAALGYGGAMVAPVAIWAALWRWELRGAARLPFRSDPVMLRRAFVLSATILINTAAINIPIILSTSTQPAAYAADFSFLMKVMAAPVALSNAILGQLFLANNIGRDLRFRKEVHALKISMRRTTIRGAVVVGLCSIALIAASYSLAWAIPGALARPDHIFPIALAALAQASFSPISNIGEIARFENRLIGFYAARVVVLYVALSITLPIDFAWLFAALSIIIFGTLWVAMDRNLERVARAGTSPPRVR